MKQLPNVFAWEVIGRWYYTTAEELAPPIAEVIQCYETEGRIVLYWPNGDDGDSGILVWDAERED